MNDGAGDLKAPFPWFGGKGRIAATVWERFGDVPNYIEPFFGSGAVLLARPHPDGTETVNDLNGFLTNFWRALRDDPLRLAAEVASTPVSELDLHARHDWLMRTGVERVAMLRSDPDAYDLRVAAWWVWGICQWIGAGWCDQKALLKRGPDSSTETWRQRPHLGDTGRGVFRASLGDAQTHRRRPALGYGRGVFRTSLRDGLEEYFAGLARRLERVRICCGDWRRVLGSTPTTHNGRSAIFLDPPYSAEAGRDAQIYAEEDLSVAHDVREWAITNGHNPLLRIALCGYNSEHTLPAGWTAVPWQAHGGLANQWKNRQRPGVAYRGTENRLREVVWFSPHCLAPVYQQADMFSGVRL